MIEHYALSPQRAARMSREDAYVYAFWMLAHAARGHLAGTATPGWLRRVLDETTTALGEVHSR